MRSLLSVLAIATLITSVSGVFSCSSSDSAPSGPQAACNQVLDETCTSMARCGVASKADCMSQGGAALDCSRAAGTSSNLQACLDALPKVDCASFPPLPSVCQGVILVNKSEGAPSTESPAITTAPITPAMNALARTIDTP
jgi:hypothetical protein